jgi:hypothetical protein
MAHTNTTSATMVTTLTISFQFRRQKDFSVFPFISRVDLKVAFIAEKLYETRESIIKFYSQFKDLDQQVEMISKTLESFKSETENKFFNIEKRLSKVEAKDLIREEILYLTTKENYEHFDSIYLKIYCLLDNLFSGTLGLIIEKSNPDQVGDGGDCEQKAESQQNFFIFAEEFHIFLFILFVIQ